MTTLKHTVEINAPKEKVWAILSNLEEVAAYNSSVSSAQYISENKTGVGASRQCQMDKNQIKERVLAVDEGKAITMEMYESDWPLDVMQWTTELTGENGKTTLTQTTQYEPGMGFLGKLMNALMMKRKFKKILDGLFVDLKKYAESK